MLTNLNLYKFKGENNLRRVIEIENLEAVTKNMQVGTTEFIIHVKGEEDIRLEADLRDQFIVAMKICYRALSRNLLPVYGVNESNNLTEYAKSASDATDPSIYKLPSITNQIVQADYDLFGPSP